jgi:hypothetical protein
MNPLKEYLKSKLTKAIKNNCVKINPENTQGLFNRNCFNNAKQHSIKTGSKMAYVIVLDSYNNNDVILHVINSQSGVFFETTLGFYAENCQYYLLSDNVETEQPYTSMVRYKNELYNLHFSLIDRIILKLVNFTI